MTEPKLTGEDKIIPIIFQLTAHCGGFAAEMSNAMFYGIPYNPTKATDALVGILRQVLAACTALGISFAEVVAESARGEREIEKHG